MLLTGFDPGQPDHSGIFSANGLSALLKAGILDTEAKSSLKTIRIFPNPTHGKIQIAGLQEGTALTVTVFSQSGQQVYSTTLTVAYELDLNNLPSGMYFVKMESEERISYEKLVLE